MLRQSFRRITQSRATLDFRRRLSAGGGGPTGGATPSSSDRLIQVLAAATTGNVLLSLYLTGRIASLDARGDQVRESLDFGMDRIDEVSFDLPPFIPSLPPLSFPHNRF